MVFSCNTVQDILLHVTTVLIFVNIDIFIFLGIYFGQGTWSISFFIKKCIISKMSYVAKLILSQSLLFFHQICSETVYTLQKHIHYRYNRNKLISYLLFTKKQKFPFIKCFFTDISHFLD